MTDPRPNPGIAGGGMMISMERESSRDRLEREAFISLFLASNQFDEQIDHLCRAEGISHPQYTVLWVLCLADAPGGLPMGALADGLLTRSADATRLVDRLVAAGHVVREPSLGDRRVVLVSPTEQGLRLFYRLTAEVKGLHRRQWGALGKDELRELIHLLNKARLSGGPGSPPVRPSSHPSTGGSPRAD
jgi:DNA-binding MarR family transcriptional regulator